MGYEKNPRLKYLKDHCNETGERERERESFPSLNKHIDDADGPPCGIQSSII